MRRLVGALTAITLGSTMVLGLPSSATAATGEFGNSCVASALPASVTLVMISGAGTNPQPAAAPATGVITKARFNLPSIPSTIPTVVKVLRATGVTNQFAVIAQSSVLAVAGGVNTYDIRIPVRAGDVLGVSGSSGALGCTTGNPGDVVGQVAGDSAPGTTATYATGPGTAIPLVATVEPDADNDGFGDLTQDLCPQSAAFQTACPVVTLDSFAAAQGHLITVLVTTDHDADVTVTGVAVVNGKKFKLKSAGQTVKAGALAQFKVSVPGPLRRALATLPAGRTIKVKLTAAATDLIGRSSSSRSSVRLHGTHH